MFSAHNDNKCTCNTKWANCFFTFSLQQAEAIKGLPQKSPINPFCLFWEGIRSQNTKMYTFFSRQSVCKPSLFGLFCLGDWDMSLEFSVLMHAASDDHVSNEMRRDQNNSINSTWRTESFVFAKYNMKHHKERDFRLTPRWMFHYCHKVWYAVSTTLHPMESEWCRTGYYFGNTYAIFRHKK